LQAGKPHPQRAECLALWRTATSKTDESLGSNAIGSSLGQKGLALGAPGIVGYVTLGRRQARRDGIMLLGSIPLFFLGGVDEVFTRIEVWYRREG